ncbi:MAG: GFA family protein, partial [Paracoccaceae bacterium]|nr:GFA family protein [Paracoccaceae bacterium]
IACHCTDCQISAGGPFRVIVQSNGEDFEITGGASEYIKTSAESGNPRIQGFCGTCGSSLYACDLNKNLFNIRAGCLENGSQFSPKIHIFGGSSPSWLKEIGKSNWLEKGPGSKQMEID